LALHRNHRLKKKKDFHLFTFAADYQYQFEPESVQ